MTLKSSNSGRSFPVVPRLGNNLKSEVVLVPSAKPRGKRERATTLVDLVPEGTTSRERPRTRDTEQARSRLASEQREFRPIVKWVGGKTKLLPQMLARCPKRFDRYFEPFAGGAALFFALRPACAFLSDANEDLIWTYQALVEDPELVFAGLRQHEYNHSKSHYYATRARWNDDGFFPHERAAAFLYLNRAGYNGLFRVNAKGELNTPFGHGEEVSFDYQNLERAAVLLSRARLRYGDYSSGVYDARKGDFVYFDPPYDGTFNAYTADKFDQRELAEVARSLVARGVHVLISNSSTELVRSLYDGFLIEVVRSPRSINADGAGRGDVDELLISNPVRKAHIAMQTEIPGTEDPDKIPAVEAAIQEWLDAKVLQRRAADTTKTKHQSIVALYQEHGIDHHTYTDPKTGNPKRLWLAKEPKAKSVSIAVRTPKKKGGPRRDQDAEIAEEKRERKAQEVETRRVSRASVEKEIASDPFAATRQAMSGETEH